MIFRKLIIFVLFFTLAGFIVSLSRVLADTITDYSVLAQNSIYLDKKAVVLSGFVGVNNPSAAPFEEGVQLLVDKKVFLEEGTRLISPSILVKKESIIKGDIYYKDQFITQEKVTLTGDIGILNAPADWPLINMPIPPTCMPDLTNHLTVAKNNQMNVPAGHYGDVQVSRNATLIFDGGEYHFNSFYADEDAKIYFNGPATLCIADTFQTKSDVFWGPQNDHTTITGADIQVYVNGVDFREAGSGKHSEELELEAVARIGKKNIIFGQVMALNGTLEIKKAAQVNGAYIAKDIIVGPNSVVTKITSGVPVDTTPPLITGINPVEGSVLNTSTPVLSSGFQDTESGVNPVSIQISLDGQDVTFQANASETGFNFVSGFLVDGVHVFSISVSDNAGNNAQTITNFTINTDMSPPRILNVSPADGSLHSGTPPRISADFYDDKAVDANSAQILLDNVDITAQSNVITTGFEFPVTTALSDGVHTLLISVRDAVGNPAQISTNFTIDTLTPDITILIPADGSLLATATPAISGSLNDATSGIDTSSVRVSVDGVDLTSQAAVTQTTFEAPVQDALNDGGHTITVAAKDLAGNPAVQTSAFTTDTTVPVISAVTPAHMSTTTANVPTISAAFADSGSGIDIASAQILVDNVNMTLQASITETGFSYTPTVPLNNGYHTVAVTIADVADNIAQAAWSFNVLLDLLPPTISNITPAAGSLLATSAPTLSAGFADNLTGVAPLSAEILLDGVEVTAQANVTASGFSFVPAALSDGAHTLSISVRDNQGNPAQASVSFTTDTTAPLIFNPVPTDGATIATDMPAISSDFFDGVSGVNANNAQILLDANDVTAQAVITADGFDLTPASPLANGSHIVEVRVADNAGNITQISFGFTVFIPVSTSVSGAITQNTLWGLANSPYIVTGNITVNSGITLTVEPGVIVKFNGFYAIEANGIINAQGTAGSPVTFTSAKSTPARGDWNYISLHNGNSVLNYVKIEYADRGVYVPYLSASPTIQNSLIQNNNKGIYFELTSNPRVLTNTITANTYGIYAFCNVWTGCGAAVNNNDIYGNSNNFYVQTDGDSSYEWIDARNNWWGTADPNGIIASTHDFLDDNTLAAIDFTPFLDGPGGSPDNSWDNRLYGNIEGNVTLTQSLNPYIVINNLVVDTGEILTVEPGVEIRFGGFYSLMAKGILNVQGTAANMINFTSHSLTPSAGDWNRIYTNNSGSQISFARIQYANVGIFSDYANMNISDSVIENNGTGIHIKGASTVNVTHNDIIHNSQVGVFVQAGYPLSIPQPNIHFNSISNNAAYNLQMAYESVNFNHSGSIINAENNWWGTDIPAGIAASIWDYYDSNYRPHVDWSPYLAAEPALAINISNVSVAGNFFNPVRSETAQVNYTIDTDSDVTINIYDQNTNAPVRTLINAQPRLAGTHAESWDGRDDTAQLLPSGVYIYIIDARTIDGKKGLYAPVQIDDTPPTVLNTLITPTGTFNPFKGDRLVVNYDLSVFARVSLGYGKSATVVYVSDEPRDIAENVDYWDGRDTAGNIVVLPNEPFYVQAQTTRLPENTIILDNRTTLDVSTLLSDPYVIRPLYNQITQIAYAINEAATVTVSILSEDGTQTFNVLEQGVSKVAGTYTLTWDGKTTAGETVAEEGDYRIRVEAVDSFGVTTRRDGNIRILF